MEGKTTIEIRAQALRDRASKAQGLLDALGGERKRWTDGMQSSALHQASLVADCSNAAFLVVYASALPGSARKATLGIGEQEAVAASGEALKRCAKLASGLKGELDTSGLEALRDFKPSGFFQSSSDGFVSGGLLHQAIRLGLCPSSETALDESASRRLLCGPDASVTMQSLGVPADSATFDAAASIEASTLYAASTICKSSFDRPALAIARLPSDTEHRAS